jgi:cytochrome c-type biogenesis protein CcmH
MKRTLFFTILLILVFLLSVVTLGQAQEANPGTVITDDEVNAVAKQLYCPVCENIPLDVCGTQACADWRAEIRLKLSEGWTEDEIKQYFVNRFGDRVLAAPPARGLNWLVYVVPPVAFSAGVFILYKGIQSLRQGTEDDLTEEIEEADSDDPYLAQFEKELKNSNQ